mgnify:CR=1 FL=1
MNDTNIVVADLKSITPMPHSQLGNPRWLIETSLGRFTTAPNAMVAYGLPNWFGSHRSHTDVVTGQNYLLQATLVLNHRNYVVDVYNVKHNKMEVRP